MSEAAITFQVVGFGEIFWNSLPSGTVDGGALMNVVYHLRALGINPTLITKVGLDVQGERIIKLLESQHISTDFFQLDNNLPTGKANISAGTKNEASYEIQGPAAWDAICWDAGFESLLKNSRYFVFGSLAMRNIVSSKTLFQLLEIAPYKILDLNLHPPHFTRKSVEALLRKTDMLKLNIPELELITGWFTKYHSEADRMQILQDKFRIQNIIVTRGSGGSILNVNGHLHVHPGFLVPVSDTKGSGDAFLAGILYKMSQSVSLEESQIYANAIGALVASRPGSCPHYATREIEEIISNNINVILPSHL